MTPTELERAFSIPRFQRYVEAAKGDYAKGYDWYKVNLRLSSKLFSVLGVFEVTFRNAVDRHYQLRYDEKWLLTQSSPDGFLTKKGCEKTLANALEVIGWRDYYAHDKVVANLGIAFWRSLFNSKEFSAGGDSLLKIFPNKPKGKSLNHTYVYNKLYPVTKIRNRIAHHDPICFAPKTSEISAEWPQKAYDSMTELITWLGFNPEIMLDGVDFVQEEIAQSFNINGQT
jgi:hypothetical protein